MNGLISFLGSATLRWLLGEWLAIVKARDDHSSELERMRLQHEQDKDRHGWQQEAIKAQADAGVKVIEAQSVASATAIADQGWLATIEQIGRSSGIRWIDGFNALIRPELAQVSIVLLVGHAVAPTYVALEGIVAEVVCSALGLFLGGRIQSSGR